MALSVIIVDENGKEVARNKRKPITKLTLEKRKEACKRIFDLMAVGRSLHSICNDPKKHALIPSTRTFYQWVADYQNKEFYEWFTIEYARAQEERAHYMFEEMLRIADDSSEDYKQIICPKTGKPKIVYDKEHVMRSRIRIDTRKWALSKMLGKYSDKHNPSQLGDSVLGKPTVVKFKGLKSKSDQNGTE